MTTTTRTTLLTRLLDLPAALRGAEQALLEAAVRHAEARQALDCREADLILCGVDGKNEMERKARPHVGCLQHAEAVADAAQERDRAAMALRVLQAEAAILRACARLLGGAGEGDEE